MKESDGYLFDTSNPAPGNTGGTGNHPRVGGGAGEVTKAEFKKCLTVKELNFSTTIKKNSTD